MQRGSSTVRNKKVRPLTAILILALLMSLISQLWLPLSVNAAESRDISGDDIVTIDSVEISKNGNPFMINGVLVEGQTPFYFGDLLGFRVNWNVTSANCDEINEGDYFEIEFPAYLNMNPVAEADVEANVKDETSGGGSAVIGKFKAGRENESTPYKMRLTFADVKRFNGITDGYMYVSGKVTPNSSEGEIITVGDIEIPVIDGPKRDTSWGNLQPGAPIRKGGQWLPSSDDYQWDIAVNIDQQYNAMFKDPVTTKENVYISDELPDGLEFSNLDIRYYEKFITDYDDRKGSWRNINDSGNYNIKGQFRYLNDMMSDLDSLTQGEFEERVRNYPIPCYAVYKKKVIAINVGDLPGSIKTPATWKEFEDMVNGWNVIEESLIVTDSIKQATLKAHANIYDPVHGYDPENGYPADGARGDVVGFYLEMRTKAVKSFTDIKNSVTMSYDNGSDTSTSSAISFTQGGAGAKIPPKGSIEITKEDTDNGEIITGVGFTLKKKEGNEFVDVVGLDEKFTDDEGKVSFENLNDGTYQIEESTPKGGYLDELIIKNIKDGETLVDNTFEINSTQTEGFAFTAYNKPVLSNVKITKKDSKTDEIITGVGFKIQKKVGDNGYADIDGMDEKFTDDDGVVTFGGLRYGDYKLVETVKKAGYQDKL